MPTERIDGSVRRGLDRLYLAGGVLAAVFLVAILLLIVAQMLARWTGVTLRGASDYAGYCMAASSFLAFAYALRRGAHIRVSLVLNALPVAGRHWLDAFCLLIGAVASSYLAFYAVRAVQWSWKFQDVSQGQDATPLWIPQLGMALGAMLLAVSFWDTLARRVLGEHDDTRQSDLDPAPAGEPEPTPSRSGSIAADSAADASDTAPGRPD